MGNFTAKHNMKNILIFIAIIFSLPAHAAEDIWLLIDTKKLELRVMSEDSTLEKFSNIAIGRNGSGFKSKRGDDITPLGTYKIS